MNRSATLLQPRRRLTAAILALSLPLLLGGCFNSSDAAMTLDLGSVSIGQQLMDLEEAKNAGVISKAEHRMIREKMMAGIAALDLDDDDDDDDDDSVSVRIRSADKEAEEDGFNWF